MPQARRSVSDGRSPKCLDQPGRSGRVLRSRSASRHGTQILRWPLPMLST